MTAEGEKAKDEHQCAERFKVTAIHAYAYACLRAYVCGASIPTLMLDLH